MESRTPKQSLKHTDDLRRRIKRRRMEIIVASVLTVAALAYLGVTLLGNSNTDGSASLSNQSQQTQ